MEDKNQSTVQQPVQSAVQTAAQNPTNQQTGSEVKKEAHEKEGLEQHGSIKNTKQGDGIILLSLSMGPDCKYPGKQNDSKQVVSNRMNQGTRRKYLRQGLVNEEVR